MDDKVAIALLLLGKDDTKINLYASSMEEVVLELNHGVIELKEEEIIDLINYLVNTIGKQQLVTPSMNLIKKKVMEMDKDLAEIKSQMKELNK